MFSINAQFDINTKKIWKGWVNIWGGAVAPLAPPISAYGLQCNQLKRHFKEIDTKREQ